MDRILPERQLCDLNPLACASDQRQNSPRKEEILSLSGQAIVDASAQSD